MSKKEEIKYFGASITKSYKSDKVQDVGFVEGIASSNTLDRGDDIITNDAMSKALEHLQKDDIKKISIKYMHISDKIVGHFLTKDMNVKDGKLFVKGSINLKTDLGKNVFELVKSGTLSDFSIGYFIEKSSWKDNVRIIEDLFIHEVSIVDLPMQKDAQITNFKNMDFADLKSERDIEKYLRNFGLSKKQALTFVSKAKNIIKPKEDIKINLRKTFDLLNEVKNNYDTMVNRS